MIDSKGKNMLGNMVSARILRLLVVAVATAMLTAVVSLPAGAQDKAVSKSELKALIANAGTKADHERISQYFDDEATRYAAEAKEHSDLAQVYQRSMPTTPTKYPGSMQTFNHCDSLSKSLLQASQDAHQLAVEHREMANEATK